MVKMKIIQEKMADAEKIIIIYENTIVFEM